ncbi:hypothetical protein Taro_002740, partial [Colocasia esculenta]|nr:hypothetical protein [Colocasia esculenta]
MCSVCTSTDRNLTVTFAAVKILGRRQPLVPLTSVGGNLCAAKFVWVSQNLNFHICVTVFGLVVVCAYCGIYVESGTSSRLCRPRRIPRLHSRLSWRLRLRLQLQFPRSMAMVVLPSWSD